VDETDRALLRAYEIGRARKKESLEKSHEDVPDEVDEELRELLPPLIEQEAPRPPAPRV